MAHGRASQHKETTAAGGGPKSAPLKVQGQRRTVCVPGAIAAHLQSRQLITSVRLRPLAGPPAGAAQSARGAAGPLGSSAARDGPRSAPAAAGRRGASSAAAACFPRTYVPVRTLPLIFAQRKRHLQENKAAAHHTEPYQQREGEGLLALPEDVLLKVVCLLSHDELKPLFQVCKALRDTLRQAVRYHFNYSTPSRPTEEAAPPALAERQRRPPRSNVYQVMSRLSRGPRAAASGRGSGNSARSTAPRALDFADTAAASASAAAAVASRA